MSKLNLVEEGFASFVVLAGMLLVAISLPVATKLVQQNQENRSNAASSACTLNAKKCSGNFLYTCKKNSSGSTYWDGSYCKNGCANNVCKSSSTTSSSTSSSSSCTNGTKKCSGGTVYKCESNKWVISYQCANGCDGTGCKVTTTPTCTYNCTDWGECKADSSTTGATQACTKESKSPTNCTGGSSKIGTVRNCTLSTATTAKTCTSFTYGSWGECDSANLQHRSVTGSSPSGCTGGSPSTTQACNSAQVCTSFKYGPWSTCSSGGVQTRTVTSKSPINCTGGNPVTSQKCTYTSSNPECGPVRNSCSIGSKASGYQENSVTGIARWSCTSNGATIGCTYTSPVNCDSKCGDCATVNTCSASKVGCTWSYSGNYCQSASANSMVACKQGGGTCKTTCDAMDEEIYAAGSNECRPAKCCKKKVTTCSYLNCTSCTTMSTCKSALCNWEILTKSCSKPTTKLTSEPGINLVQYDKDVRQIVEEKGYKTREAAVAAALYLAEEFPYHIVYHSKGGTTNDIYQLKSGFINKYDNTYTNYFGATTKLKDKSGRNIVGLSCSGLVEWAYRTAGFDAGLDESRQNIDTTTVSVTNSDGTKKKVQKSHWINIAGGTNSTRRQKVLDTVKPGDLVYTGNIDGIRHEAIITAIDASTDTVTIVQSSASEGVNVAYIDLVTLKAKNGSKNNFSLYASLDGYYQLYGDGGYYNEN